MIVLIPAYEPGDSLIDLVRDLGARPEVFAVLVVDDGSGFAYADAFARAAAAGATVVRYLPNLGKGHGLKVGFREAEARFPGQVVVCADSDGQHRVDDIVRVGQAVQADDEMVIGGRRFTGTVPVRSRIGNSVTAVLFRMLTGVKVGDTQTGLRAYPPSMLAWLRGVKGERFEYELSLLLEAEDAGWRIREIPIETVYLEGNASSHFRPVRDSWRVYRPLLSFGAASLAGFIVDTVLLLSIMALSGSLLLSAVLARIVSAAVNYQLNRRVTFGRGDGRSPLRYVGLAAAVFAANFAVLWTLDLVMPLALAKVLTEIALFGASYLVQQRFVFRCEGRKAPADVRVDEWPESHHIVGTL